MIRIVAEDVGRVGGDRWHSSALHLVLRWRGGGGTMSICCHRRAAAPAEAPAEEAAPAEAQPGVPLQDFAVPGFEVGDGELLGNVVGLYLGNNNLQKLSQKKCCLTPQNLTPEPPEIDTPNSEPPFETTGVLGSKALSEKPF